LNITKYLSNEQRQDISIKMMKHALQLLEESDNLCMHYACSDSLRFDIIPKLEIALKDETSYSRYDMAEKIMNEYDYALSQPASATGNHSIYDPETYN